MADDLIVGIHAVTSILRHQPHRVLRVWLVDKSDRFEGIIAAAKTQDIPVEMIAKSRLDAAVDASVVHQGVAVWVKPQAPWTEQVLSANVAEWMKAERRILLLVLDNVQDPHNLGACFRSADAFGVDAIIVPRHESSKITPVVRKVASGAAETVPLAIVGNLARTLESLQKLGVWVVGLAGEADQPLSQAALRRPCALVLGAEGDGMRAQTRTLCDELASIPLVGTVDSLNVSVAAGVSLYEVIRQRGK